MPNAAQGRTSATPVQNPLILVALVGVGALLLGGYWWQARIADEAYQRKQSAAAVKNEERSLAKKRLYDAIVQRGDTATIRAASTETSPDYLVSLFNNIVREGQLGPIKTTLPVVMEIRPDGCNRALSSAASYGYTDIVDALLKAGVKPNGAAFETTVCPPLVSAAMPGHLETVRRLLDAGADVESGATSTLPGPLAGMTPLMAASQGGHVPLVRLLLSRGAKVNYRSATGLTALRLCRHPLSSYENNEMTGLPERAQANSVKARQSINLAEVDRLLVKAGAKE